jgi:RNA polymerase-binding transcription factor DksA
MKQGDAAIELAEHRVELERAAGIARIQAAARGQVPSKYKLSPFCRDCGERIPDDRRAAMPRAERCFDCESLNERLSRKRA